MKSILGKMGVILFGLIIFGHAEVWGKDWKLFKKTDDAKFYYDKKDVTHPVQEVVEVWIRQVYTQKGKTDMVNLVGSRYGHLSYSINALEFNCKARLIRFLSMTYYSENGDVLDLENPPDKWESIRSNSMFDALHKEVCK